MSNNNEPMIVLEPGGKAPILSYNVPEPTSYSGRNYIELDIPPDRFRPSTSKKPSKTFTAVVKELDHLMLRDRIISGMKAGFCDPELFGNIKMATTPIGAVEKPNPGLAFVAAEPAYDVLASLDPETIAARFEAGEQLTVYRTLFGTYAYKFFPAITMADPRLLLVETYRFSSYLGNYGAGRVVKTFSLLPGERTKISVKTYMRRETDAKSASSIFDSFTQESAHDFETSVGHEQSNKQNYEKTFAYHAEAEASASWGFGSAKVSGGVKGGTNSAREEFAKNIANAAEKHANKASAKRDVQINTSYEVKEEAGEETSTEREIENINVSRTLNFVFRQMNQEFITLLYLVDVRVAFFNGFSYREASLPELDSLLEEVIVETKQDEVKQAIVGALGDIYDYNDKHHSLVEKKEVKDKDGNVIHEYLRARKGEASEYCPDPSGEGLKIQVPGIILSATKHVLRTEGIIVEALLGQGDGLDRYSHGLQDETVRAKALANELLKEQIEREKLGQKIVETKDDAAAKIYEQVFPPPRAKDEEEGA